MTAVLRDHRTAPVSERVRAMLEFLAKLTMHAEDVTGQDIAPLRAVGLGDRAITEALHVCFAFDVMSRLADTFDFHAPDDEYHRRTARMLRRLGYTIASLPG